MEVLRFLPDTHVWVDDAASLPQILNDDLRAKLEDIELPVGVEPLYDLPFDLRVFVFGARCIALAWRRSERAEIVDVRGVDEELDIRRVEISVLVAEMLENIRNRFDLKLFSVDFVSDLECNNIPVDLNISPTWSWLPSQDRSVLDEAFATFIAKSAVG